MDQNVAPDASSGVAREARNEGVWWFENAAEKSVPRAASLRGTDEASAPTQSLPIPGLGNAVYLS